MASRSVYYVAPMKISSQACAASARAHLAGARDSRAAGGVGSHRPRPKEQARSSVPYGRLGWPCHPALLRYRREQPADGRGDDARVELRVPSDDGCPQFRGPINHSTVSHYSFCNQAGVPPGVTRQSAPSLTQLTTKAQIVKALDDSISYCNTVLLAASESWLMEIAPRVGGSSSGLVEGIRAHAFMYNNAHDTEDYGTITTYLRLNGIVPPSSALHPSR